MTVHKTYSMQQYPSTKLDDRELKKKINDIEAKKNDSEFVHHCLIDDKLSRSKVVNFYKNKNVLITGGTGFLGKILLLKLLTTCKDIGKIYLLLRPKKEMSPENRLIQLLKGKPFCLKYKFTDMLAKCVAIESDMTEDGLGLSQIDRTLLQEQVHVVIHSAASVRFDAPLKENIRDNVHGTRSIVELCNGIKNLNAFVHVSTAYSNCQAHDIGENIEPLKRNVDDVVTIVESLPNEACQMISDKLLEGRPNTYTYTKAMAEQYVSRQEGKYPISIIRPSIVISSAQEPFPGWVDNLNGISGLGCLGTVGVLRTIDWNYYATCDMVPVDFVANCIICAAYQANLRSPTGMLIYNMTSGSMSPVSWGSFFDILINEAKKKPSNKIIRPIIKPPRYQKVNPVSFFLTRILSELLFAYIFDVILVLIGSKKVLIKITQKMHNGYKVLKPFTTNEWNFQSNNVINMSESLSPIDRELFKFDMRNFDWNEQARNTWNGIRLLILKEEAIEESYRTARARQTFVTFIYYGFIIFSLISLLFVGYSSAKSLISLLIF